MEDYCVYLHRRGTTGEIFYVGKGKGDRPWSRQGRNEWWNRIVEKHGFTVEIYMSGLQEWYSYELEKELIDYYGRANLGEGPLCNLVDGGPGATGNIKTPEMRAKVREKALSPDSKNRDRNVYTFVNIYTKQEETLTRYAFWKKYGFKLSGIFTKPSTCRDWCLKENLDKIVGEDSRLDMNIYTFIHLDGRTFTGTRVEFKRVYGMQPANLFHGQVKFVQGWSIYDGTDKSPKEDLTIYKLANKLTGETFEGTRIDFKKKYRVNIKPLFIKNRKLRSLSCKGWYLLEPLD